jgi:hypothetical protein
MMHVTTDHVLHLGFILGITAIALAPSLWEKIVYLIVGMSIVLGTILTLTSLISPVNHTTSLVPSYNFHSLFSTGRSRSVSLMPLLKRTHHIFQARPFATLPLLSVLLS